MDQSQKPVDLTSDEHLTGLVERVTFHSEESGYCVVKVKVRGHRELVTVVGTLASVTAGEWLDAHGRWVVDPKHGQQFKATFLRTSAPHTADGITHYLGSGVIHGVGPELASRLVSHFGIRVMEIIEKSPERLTEVDGIGPARRTLITLAWQEQKTVRDIMLFLHSHGVSTSRAFRIYKTYGADAIEKVQSDPYRLARDIRGIGFASADGIANRLGIAKDSELRARAGVEFVLQDLTNEGHCAFPRDSLITKTANMLEIPSEIVAPAVDHGVNSGRLVEKSSASGQRLVYLAKLESAERWAAANLTALTRGPHPCPKIDVEKACTWVESKIGITLADAQRAALTLATQAKVLVITGGPGVGKTTLVNAIVKVLHAKNLRLVLAAPTGRAAKRMNEATGIVAKTIHRLLEVDPANGKFRHDHNRPLTGDVFIIDESSMIDLPLAHSLFRAIPQRAALILVGDVDQLPSVGPGNVLSDIMTSGVVPVCRLTEIFRQAAKSTIITNAHRINEGQMPRWPRSKAESDEDSDFFFVEAEDPLRAVELLIKLVRDHIPQRFGFDPLNDIQVLTPMQRGELGARNLNQVLREALNPVGTSIQRYGFTFRVNDKVMQIENNYDKDIFNGDIGRIKSINEELRQVVVSYDDRPVAYSIDELDELMPAYATTIHKAQGSEYPAVVFPIHTQHYVLLQRNLLYTAITRGRKLVILIGTPKALAIAVKRVEARSRFTTLQERLREANAKPSLFTREWSDEALPKAAEPSSDYKA